MDLDFTNQSKQSLAQGGIDLGELWSGQFNFLSVPDIRLNCISFQVNAVQLFVGGQHRNATPVGDLVVIQLVVL